MPIALHSLRNLAAGLISASMLFTVARSEPASAQNTPYEVNVILSRTGAGAFLGGKEAEALTALESAVNATGGIRGRPLKLVIADDQTNPQVAVQLVNGLISRKVPVIIGPMITASCAAVQPIVEKDGPVVACLSPGLIPHENTYVFLAAPTLDDVEPVLLRYVASRGWTRLALITTTDASGQDFERRLDPILSRSEFRGLQIVDREHFAPADLDVTSQVARMKAARPDVVLTVAVGTPFGTLLRSISNVGLDVPVFGNGANMNVAQLAQYSSFMPKELFFNAMRGIEVERNPPRAIKAAQTFYFDALKRAGYRPEAGTTIAWDLSMVVVDALRHVGTDATAAQVFQYIEGLKNWAGVQGTYDFTTHDQRGIGEAAAAFFQWDSAKGDFLLIYPKASR
jgi:branched-chain amino acid transport system substrate-binding protein